MNPQPQGNEVNTLTTKPLDSLNYVSYQFKTLQHNITLDFQNKYYIDVIGIKDIIECIVSFDYIIKKLSHCVVISVCWPDTNAWIISPAMGHNYYIIEP